MIEFLASDKNLLFGLFIIVFILNDLKKSVLNFSIHCIQHEVYKDLQYEDFEEAQEEAILCHSRRGIKRESIMTHS
jgi:hypothetical protein